MLYLNMVILILLLKYLKSIILLILDLNLFVNFIIISMIENVSHFILGMIFGLSVYLFIRISIVSKKLDRIEDRIGKLASDFNDIIRKFND